MPTSTSRASRIRWRVAVCGLATIVFAALALGLDAAFPPDLSRLGDPSPTLTARRGELLRVLPAADGRLRLGARAEDMPPFYLAALKAYEDARFDAHPGIDPAAVLRALWQDLRAGRTVSGASTLTMQVARMLEPRPRNVGAKLVEMLRALQLEWRYDKREILGMYLTLAPFGGAVEGVRAASLVLYGKEPRFLDPAESALLVALPQSPTALRPDRDPARARAARDKVLARAAARGLLTPAALAEAQAEPLPSARHALPATAPHLAARLARAGRTEPSTIDAALQRAVEDLLRRQVPALGAHGSVAVLVVDNRTREVRAYAGGVEFLDDARAGQVDMVRARRSPGSALKPFIYGLGFDDGLIAPDTLIVDAPTSFDDWAPENFDRQWHGDVSVRVALQQSLNIPAVAVLSEVGAFRFVHALTAAGARLAFPAGTERPGLPVALGGAAISLWDLATLYAGLADRGSVKTLRLHVAEGAGDPGVALLSPAAAAQVTAILQETPPPPGLPQIAGARLPGSSRSVIAHKTGTSYGFRDAWAIGYTAGHTVAVWEGRPDGTPVPDRYGRTAAAPLLFRIFDLLPASAGAPAADIDARGAPGLASFRAGKSARVDTGLGAREGLRLLFPLGASTFPTRTVSGEPTQVSLKASGGRRPLRWLVDGTPVAAAPPRQGPSWQPDGPGFHRVTVIDSDGASASVEVRVVE